MLVNISENFASKKDIITAEVGKAFSLEERTELNGVSYPKLPITAASLKLYNLLILNEKGSFCSVEMRPKGIIIGFTSLMERYAFLIPYYKLKIYKGKAEEYSFYKDDQYIKVWASAVEPEVHKFIRKIKNYKSGNAPTQVEDLL
ncbi:MAG TPA: hypothetical protein VFI78_02680 [Salinimicrobium sp.]|nr:hypothetical protein [Salinimicrobium sp.]